MQNYQYDNHEETNLKTLLAYRHIDLLGKNICYFREVTSTNSIAKFMAQFKAPEGTIVMSSFQKTGRGRMQRQWFCPPGQGILMSMVLRPKTHMQFLPQLTLLTAVVVAETIQKVTGCEAGIKWPNDILINGKKVCGILAESSFSSGSPEYVIMGLGINVNLDTDQLPPDCRETSTSLKIELGRRVSRYCLLKDFLNIWEEYYQCFLHDGNAYLRPKWIDNNVTLGRYVTIIKENEALHGRAVDITARGGLMVSFADERLEEFLAEDLTLGKTHYERRL